MYDVVVIECYYGSFGTGALHYVMDRRSEEEESCGAAGGIIKVPMKAMKLVVVWAWRKPIKRGMRILNRGRDGSDVKSGSAP